MRYLIPILVVVSLIVIGVGNAWIKISEDERLVVFRLGRAVGIRKPGRVMLIPYLESGVKYNITDPFDARLVADYQAQFDEERERQDSGAHLGS